MKVITKKQVYLLLMHHIKSEAFSKDLTALTLHNTISYSYDPVAVDDMLKGSLQSVTNVFTELVIAHNKEA